MQIKGSYVIVWVVIEVCLANCGDSLVVAAWRSGNVVDLFKPG